MKKKQNGPVEIAPSVYWIGTGSRTDILQTNAYLLVRDSYSVLIDPGPVQSFEHVYNAVSSVTRPQDVKAIVATHQDPDVCASLPLWERHGFEGSIYAHWRTSILIVSYGLNTSPVHINEKNCDMSDKFPQLKFIPTPYLHSPGAMAVFDPASDILFSSDLLGALGATDDLYADGGYIKRMVHFHENYMPSSKILRHAIDTISKIHAKAICPQHGSIIEGDFPKYFDALRNAACGNLNPILVEGNEEPSEELLKLQEANFDLQEMIVLNQDEKLKDPVTHLYSGEYLKSYLPAFIESNPEGTVAVLRLDDMSAFNRKFGADEGNRIIATFASLLLEMKPPDALLLRDTGPALTLLLSGNPENTDKSIIKELQGKIAESGAFIQPMTCSAAVIGCGELTDASHSAQDMLERGIRLRYRVLEQFPKEGYCDSVSDDVLSSENDIILIIDPDTALTSLLQNYLGKYGYEVLSCHNGSSALRLCDTYRPKMIVSEINVPEIDGFRIKNALLHTHDLKHTPFVFVSYVKTEDSLARGFRLGVRHFLQKPFMPAELLGLLELYIKGRYDA